MTDKVNAEIVAIGTELLLGEITDTNSVYLAQQLRHLGINLYFMTTVGDNEGRIADALKLALDRADLVITCGGLGPTVDDMTRQSVAAATNRGLTYHENLYQQIVERFASFKTAITENNKRQAYLPDNAIAIENPVGTAPSFIVEHQGKAIISLPGVPREMKFLFQEAVIPYLHKTYNLGTIKAHILKTAGIGESTLDEALGSELLNAPNPSIGLAAHNGVIHIRITAKAETEAQADEMIAVMEEQVRTKVGDYIFGVDDDELEMVLINTLRGIGAKIAVLEAGITGAAIAKLETAQGWDILAATQVFTHPNELRTALEHGDSMSLRILSEQLAQNITEQHGAKAGIAILSLPDIDEKSDVAEGTAVAIYTSKETKSRIYGFGGKNPLARDWVSRWALAYLWRQLKEEQ